MFEVEGVTNWHITVRRRQDRCAWRFQVGYNATQSQRTLLSGTSFRQDSVAPADCVIDALVYASKEARRLNLID